MITLANDAIIVGDFFFYEYNCKKVNNAQPVKMLIHVLHAMLLIFVN